MERQPYAIVIRMSRGSGPGPWYCCKNEVAYEYLRKGRAALIEGRLQWRSWDGQGGQKRNKHEVIAERIQFMPWGREEGMERPSPGPSRAGEESERPPSEADEIPF